MSHYECISRWRGHRWSKWGEPRETTEPDLPTGSVVFVQERICARCNAHQFRSVNCLRWRSPPESHQPDLGRG